MKRKTKTLFALFLALCLTVGLVPIQAQATGSTTATYETYFLEPDGFGCNVLYFKNGGDLTDKITKVLVDNKEIQRVEMAYNLNDSSNGYQVWCSDGMTEVRLGFKLWNSLSLDSHTLTVILTDGRVDATFIVDSHFSMEPAFSYEITEGEGSSFAEDSSGNLTFTANGDFSKFKDVKVDGNVIDKANYTAESGSTIITLKNEYLKTLSSGEHTIAVVYTDGEAAASFTVGTQKSSKDRSRPEAYSWGETYGDIRVEKDGGGVKAAVIRREGNEIETIVHPYISAPTRAVTPAAGVYSFDLTLVDAYNDYSFVTLKEGPVPVRFYVPGVEWDTPVIVRQWIGNQYVDLPVEVGNGSIKATFSTLSVSTVAVIVGQDGSAVGISGTAGTGTGMVSPKTGESSIIYAVGALALLSLAGMIVCEKKKRA